MKLVAEANTDVYVSSTFFYPKLVRFGSQAVCRWTKETDLFSKRLLLVPVHLGAHWCLASISTADLQIVYYDSLHEPNPACLETLKSYFREIIQLCLYHGMELFYFAVFHNRQIIQTVVCLYAELLGAWLTKLLSTLVNVIWLALGDKWYIRITSAKVVALNSIFYVIVIPWVQGILLICGPRVYMSVKSQAAMVQVIYITWGVLT